MIHHSKPTFGPEEEKALVGLLRSGEAGSGRPVERFERAISKRIGVGFVTATHSGTAALHLALLALGIKTGDRVILPTYLCAAVLHAVRYVGARPVLVDVDPLTGNVDPADVRRKARRARAIIVPHLFGLPAPIGELARIGPPVIEDCAMALGARTGKRACGAHGTLSIFSFYATKMLATGHGGAVATDRSRTAARVRDLVAYDNRMEDRLRYNYRMSGLAAALGGAQLKRLGEFVKLRRRIADQYYETLKDCPIGLPKRAGNVFYRFVVRMEPERTGRTGTALMRRLQERGIEAKRPVFLPLHRYGSESRASYPGAESIYRTAVSLPIYPGLAPQECRRVVSEVVAFLA